MLIVVFGNVGIVLKLFELSKSISIAVSVLRALRILRFARLLKEIKSVGIIIDAAITILPNIINVMSIFVLALFVYACIGMNLFAQLKHRDVINERFSF